MAEQYVCVQTRNAPQNNYDLAASTLQHLHSRTDHPCADRSAARPEISRGLSYRCLGVECFSTAVAISERRAVERGAQQRHVGCQSGRFGGRQRADLTGEVRTRAGSDHDRVSICVNPTPATSGRPRFCEPGCGTVRQRAANESTAPGINPQERRNLVFARTNPLRRHKCWRDPVRDPQPDQ